jgi:hypothetical protein
MQLEVLGPFAVSGTSVSITAGLYNGNTLLGTASTDPITLGNTPGSFTLDWKSPTSLWPNSPPKAAVIDFTSILNGSIQGRIDLTVTGGSITIPPPPVQDAPVPACCILLEYRNSSGMWTGLPGSVNNIVETLVGPQSQASAVQRLAQVADGAGWRTSFAFVNLDPTAVNFTMRFWGQDGQPLAMPLANGSTGEITATIPAGQSWFMATPGSTQNLVQGWAEVASSGHLGITAIFSRTMTGTQDSEGTVSGAGSGGHLVLPYDNMQGFVTGIALANSSSDASESVSVLLHPESGSSVQGSITIPKHGQVTLALTSAFPAVANTRGVIELIGSAADLTAIGLRFSPAGSFTSVPVFPE